MDEETQLWNQYQNLRDEIKSADAVIYQIMGLVVGASAAILVAGFNQSDLLLRCFIFLCVFVVTYPGYQLLYSSRRRIWRISTYLRVFVEPELEHIKWETRLHLQREHALDKTEDGVVSSAMLRHEWFIMTAMNSIALVAVIVGLALYYRASPRTQTQIAVAICLITAALIVYLCIYISTSRQENDLRRSGKIEKNFYNSWEKVKQHSDKVK